jgi:O-methyltransferase involved in polyketide biosynthesis
MQPLTLIQQTLFVTLAGRAQDSARARPILGDTLAATVLAKLGSDRTVPTVQTSIVLQIALRTKMLDTAVRQFVAAHPDAVVVDLGAGLDGARERVAPPPSIDWYDVDFPAVTALRQELLPPTARGHAVGASLIEPDWSASIPADRPTILFANGLLAFLTEPQIIALLRAVTGRFQHGELVFNDYGRLAASAWAMRVRSATTRSITALKTYPGFNDPHQPQRWAPRLCLVEETSLTRAPEVALFPPVLRTVTRLSAHSRALARKARILRYAF